MMNLPEYLLVKLAEECAEVQQRVTKALTFTLDEVQPGQEESNRERIAQELDDLLAVVEMLKDAHVLRDKSLEAMFKKKLKVRKFMDYSRERGTLR